MITGRDLSKKLLIRDKLHITSLLQKPPTHLALRQGDILIPNVTRKPHVRLIGNDLEGIYPHHTVTLLRRKASAPSTEKIMNYLTSYEFFDALTRRVSMLDGNVRITAKNIVDMPFELPSEADKTSTLVLILQSFTHDLIKLIAKNRAALNKIEWRDLERVLATAFDGLGFDVELTPPSKDGGKDLVLYCMERDKKKSYVVEVKHWVSGKKVSGTELKKFIEVVVRENHDAGLFLATAGFSQVAFKAVAHLEHRYVRLAGSEKVERICQMFVATQSGLLMPKQSPIQIFHDSTQPIISQNT